MLLDPWQVWSGYVLIAIGVTQFAWQIVSARRAVSEEQSTAELH